MTDVAEAKNAASKANEAASKAQGEATAANKAASDAQTKAADAQQVATNAQQAADKAQSDLAALTSRVTTAETKITQTNEAITAQANRITETSNKVGEIQNDISNNYYSKEQTDAQIKVSADKISQTVSEVNKTATSANDKIDNLYIGGRNLLRNSSKFPILKESNYSTGAWRLAGNSNMTRDHVDIADPPLECYQITGAYQAVGKHPTSVMDAECIGIDMFPYFKNCKLGDTCTFSAWARVVGGGSDCYFGFSSYLLKDMHTDVYNHDKVLNNYACKELNKDGSWTRVIINFKLTASTTNNIYVGFITGNDEVTVQACAIKLEIGNKATDWTPAPEDQEQYVKDKIAASEKTTEDSYKALIDQTAHEINLLVQSVKSTADSNSSSISTIASNLKVTSDGLNATKTSINTLIDAVNGTVSKEELQQYIRWNGGDLELGNSVQPFRCRLSNTELAFYQNEDKVAWISNKELYILKAIIAQSIGCGNFMFIDEGDLGFSLI